MKKLTKFSNIYLIFCLYSLIGWLYEVLWMWFVVPPKHFVNRGVLFGPFLPIYGFGVLILLLFLHNFLKNKHEFGKPMHFFVSTVTVVTFIYTTIIEYTTPKIYSVFKYLTDYGIGLVISNVLALAILYVVTKKSKKIKELDVSIVLTFLYIWIIATAVEYVAHFVVDKVFHQMLWDYTKDFLNINKRVNWDASRNFAIIGTTLLYTVQPLFNKLLDKMRDKTKYIITLVIGIPMLIDFIINVILK